MADDDDEDGKDPGPREDDGPARPRVKAAPKKARVPRRKPAEKKAAEDTGRDVQADVVEVGGAQRVTIADERAARRALGAGALLGAVGLALVGTGPSEAGGIICVAGLLVLIYGIHTFGRLGAEPTSAK
jgi:hypothetical protein